VQVVILAWEEQPTGTFWLPTRCALWTVLDATVSAMLDLTYNVHVMCKPDSPVRVQLQDAGVRFITDLSDVPQNGPYLMVWGDCSFPSFVDDMLHPDTALVAEGSGSIGWNAQASNWTSETNQYALRGWVYSSDWSGLIAQPLPAALDALGIQPRLSDRVHYVGDLSSYGDYLNA